MKKERIIMCSAIILEINKVKDFSFFMRIRFDETDKETSAFRSFVVYQAESSSKNKMKRNKK